MGVPVSGFGIVLGDVPPGGLVLLEGGLAPAKNQVARDFAQQAASLGRPVTVVASAPSAGEPEGIRTVEATSWDPRHLRPGDDLVVDSFSLLSLGSSPADVAHAVRAVRHACRAAGSAALLVVDEGQFAPAALAACHHLADGVLQFRERDDADGPVLYARAPKWVDGKPCERNIYYTYDGARILIDTRRRVN